MLKTFFLLVCIALFSCCTYAEDSNIALENAPINRDDIASIQRGAKWFATICISCHTLVYLRYNKLAQQAGITYEKMPINFKLPDGTHPPDLSLEASVRGVDWIDTYLHSFYLDPTRPTGFNNLLVQNTVMPDMLAGFRGKQVRSAAPVQAVVLGGEPQWYDVLTLQQQGTLSPQDFDNMVADIVNFLAYAAEPYRQEQRRIGWWALAFLAVFFVLVYLLKKEYWKDIK